MICQDIPFIVLSYDLTAHEKKPEIHTIIFGTRKFVLRKWLTLLRGTQEITDQLFHIYNHTKNTLLNIVLKLFLTIDTNYNE